MKSNAPPPGRYTTPAIVLHWTIALLIVGALAVGSFAADLPVSPTRLKLLTWHKWVGVTILGLSLLRLAWRVGHTPPPGPPMPRWPARAAAGAHALLYALAIMVPIAGWAYSNAAGFPVVWLGVLPLPELLPANKALAATAKAWHAALAWGLAALAAGHVGAAVWHQWIRQDRLLERMNPWPLTRAR